MLAPPNTGVDQQELLADWIELSTLLDEIGSTSREEVRDALVDLGLLGLTVEDLGGGVPDYPFALSQQDDDAAYVEAVFAILGLRARCLGSAYPFEVDAGLIRRKGDSWRVVPAYLFLLMIDLAQYYDATRYRVVRITADSNSSRLFEKIVEAALRMSFGRLTSRFGWPREDDWPQPINERIGMLGDVVQLRVENLDGKTSPDDKDKGLDVLGRWLLACDPAGGIALLTQCAVGKRWREKTGEPSVEEWLPIFVWDSVRVRAVALPRRLQRPWDRRRVFAHFDGAVVLDRLRLMASHPDSALDPGTRDRLVDWCDLRLGNFGATSE